MILEINYDYVKRAPRHYLLTILNFNYSKRVIYSFLSSNKLINNISEFTKPTFIIQYISSKIKKTKILHTFSPDLNL